MAVLHRNCACLLNFKNVIRSIQNHLLNLMNVNHKSNMSCFVPADFHGCFAPKLCMFVKFQESY